MSCCVKTKGTETFAMLQFEREQLLYDIKNYCYVEGHIMPDDTEVHVRHTVQDVGEEGNVDRVSRVLNLAIERCRELLYPYTKEEAYITSLNDILKKPDSYWLVLSLPKEFSQTTLYLLENLIHEYLVCMAVADWLSITNPEKAQIWETKANEAIKEAHDKLRNRTKPLRRKQHPF